MRRDGFSISSNGTDDAQWREFKAQGLKRETVYTYNDPTSYLDLLNIVESRWLNYFERFLGCVVATEVLCAPGPVPVVHDGNPCDEAARRREATFSTMVDNISKVTINGRVEVESEYVLDPFNQNFDRVVRQRYGGNLHASTGSTLFDTNLPEFLFDFVTAGPINAGELFSVGSENDRTEGFLPQTIRDMYPLERVPETAVRPHASCANTSGCVAVSEDLYEHPIVDHVLCNDSASFHDRTHCDLGDAYEHQSVLPGFLPTFDYFQTSAVESKILRSRLTCEQLAEAQLEDPFHNDNLNRVEEDPNGGWIFEVGTGHRARVKSDLRRICQWTTTTDRDGDRRFYGLNFHGRTLVEAVEDVLGSEQFVFHEMLYNADGNIIERRDPKRTPIDEGAVIYRYDEVNPAGPPVPGSEGANEWLPAWWSRRSNLLNVEYRPSTPVYEHGRAEASLSRGVDYRYEPMFNERLSETWYTNYAQTGRIDQYRIARIFDYQELSLPQGQTKTEQPDPSTLDANSLVHSLLRQISYGVYWLDDGYGKIDNSVDANGDRLLGDWQLNNIHLYGVDINGDGIWATPDGVPDTQLGRHDNAKALPIKIERTDLTAPLGAPGRTRTTILTWAPHGRPSSILNESGQLISFDYYSTSGNTDEIYGNATRPALANISQGHRGYLARVTSRTQLREYPASQGPPTPPCAQLPGPYQWLLESCSNPASELAALGIAPDVVEQILAASTSATPVQTTEFSYARDTGQPWKRWEDNDATFSRRVTTLVHDSDGRLVESIDPKLNWGRIYYTIEGWPRREIHTDGTRVLSDTEQQFDNVGNVTARCRALQPDACVGVVNTTPGTPVLGAFGVDYQLEVSTYTNEDQLSAMSDPAGVITQMEYDADKRLINQWSSDPNGGRQVRFFYDDRGQLLRRMHGTDATRSNLGPIDEFWIYDGYGRVITYTDPRDFAWQYGWDGAQLRATKQDPCNYLTCPGPGTWEVQYDYNGHDEVIGVNDNALQQTTIVRKPQDGLPYQVSRTGAGTIYFTHDAQGSVVWTRDAAGNDTLSTQNLLTGEFGAATVRRDDGQVLTTSSFTLTDEYLQPISVTQYGHGALFERTETITRDAAGFVTDLSNPAAPSVSYVRNLAGWPEQVIQFLGAADKRIHFGYDARGAITSRTDEAGEITTYEYSPWNELLAVYRPGTTGPWSLNTYDGFGRVQSITTANGATLDYTYGAGFGHLPYQISQGTEVLRTLNYDSFARPIYTWEANDGNPVSQEHHYDDLGRRIWAEQIVNIHGTIRNDISSSVYQHDSNTDRWSRQIQYPTALSVTENYDQVGRIASMSWEGRTTDFHHLGGLYRGRDQTWDGLGTADPLRELIELDDFGESASRSFSVLDIGASGPTNAQWADDYCVPGASFDASRCSTPLFKEDLVRDLGGRVRSVQTRFGHPMVFDGLPMPGADHEHVWRGFNFDDRHALSRSWEYEQLQPIDDSSLVAHTNITDADIDAVAGATSEAAAWDRLREPSAGGLSRISSPTTGEVRWNAGARAPGHRLTDIDSLGQTWGIAHDNMGNVTSSVMFGHEYDAFGRLFRTVDPATGTPIETYRYDALNQLVAIEYGSGGGEVDVLHWDGDQMIAATDLATDTALWDAVFSPGHQDKLLGTCSPLHRASTEDCEIG